MLISKSKKEEDVGRLTTIVSDIACKRFGAVQIGTGGLDKLTFPLKYAAVKRDETKEVVLCQVAQDVD